MVIFILLLLLISVIIFVLMFVAKDEIGLSTLDDHQSFMETIIYDENNEPFCYNRNPCIMSNENVNLDHVSCENHTLYEFYNAGLVNKKVINEIKNKYIESDEWILYKE